ncbi:MAG: right-handed parallel beta-helix repeat-containing protein [Pirellulales bacterium]
MIRSLSLVLFLLWHCQCSISLAQDAATFIDFEPHYGNRAWYVSGTGSDLNNGKTLERPFRTLQKAADQTLPGDTVWILNGTYTAEGSGSTVLFISRSGTANNWIRYKAYPGNLPVIRTGSHWSGITVGGAAYIELNGLSVEGNQKQISLDYAKSQAGNLHNASTSGNGISVCRDDGRAVHHVLIRNCHVYDCCGGGIATEHADYMRIEENLVHNNAYYSPYSQSGISVYSNWSFDHDLGIKIIVRHNTCYENRNYIPSYYSATNLQDRVITDGNGIIIDDLQNSLTTPVHAPYTGSVVVIANHVYDNGGRGVMVFKSDHVLVSNNLLVNNAATSKIRSELLVNGCTNVTLLDNSIFPRANRLSFQVIDSTLVKTSK